METSNIIGGSNIYPCKGSPLSDQEFVNHIEDYRHIKAIRQMQEFRQASVTLTKKQVQLLEIEMRCALLRRSDPCWGYIEGKGVRSRCIEGRCPQILKCNPTYKPEDTIYWTMTEEDKVSYGRPNKQKKYYLVDLVSDEERLKYISNPKGAGKEFPPIKDTESEKTKSTAKPKERQLVIIGYEETYFGDADNQLSPIWGYVDDSEDSGPLVTNQYGSKKEVVHQKAVKQNDAQKVKQTIKIKNNVEKPIEIKPEPKPEKPEVKQVEVLDEDKKAAYESVVNNKISGEYQLTELTQEIISQLSGGLKLDIVLANEAERAYVSSMLLQVAIEHDVEIISESAKACLWSAISKDIAVNGNVMVSGEFAKQGCSLENEKAWAEIGKANAITKLSVTGRDFFSFKSIDNVERWGCRNLYGATHIAVRLEDFNLNGKISGEQKISLMKDAKNYIVLSTSTAEQIGVTNEAFGNALDILKKADEISELPRLIVGLILKESGAGLEIKGIGHMKFDEY